MHFAYVFSLYICVWAMVANVRVFFPFFHSILTVVYGSVNLAPTLTLKFQMILSPRSAWWRASTQTSSEENVFRKVFRFVFELWGPAHIYTRSQCVIHCLRETQTRCNYLVVYNVPYNTFCTHGCGIVYKLVKERRNFESIFFCLFAIDRCTPYISMHPCLVGITICWKLKSNCSSVCMQVFLKLWRKVFWVHIIRNGILFLKRGLHRMEIILIHL